MGDIVRRERGGKFIGWSVRYKDTDGRRKIRASHQPTREAARRFLVEIEARVARGLIGLPAPAPLAPTVRELGERFVAEYRRPGIKDLAVYRGCARRALQRFYPALGRCPADTVRPADVAAARDALARRCAPGTIRIGLSFLSTLYSWAVKGGIVAHNPVKGVERPTTEPSRDFFSREEVRAILDQLDGWVASPTAYQKSRLARCAMQRQLTACCLQFALHTGLRKGELLGLRWRDLDLDTRRLTVARSYKAAPKSGKARHLRLPAACVPLLKKWQSLCPITAEGLVFPINRQVLDRHTESLLRAAGVRTRAHPFHTLRHTFASHFVMAGGNLLSLQQILGHSDVKMTMLYAHLAPEFLGAELDRLKF